MPKTFKLFKNEEKALKYRNSQRKKNYASGQFNSKKKIRFTLAEDKMVMSRKITDRQLAEALDRSIQSIQMRRYKLIRGLVHSDYQPFMELEKIQK